jgi:hypothetical protein
MRISNLFSSGMIWLAFTQAMSEMRVYILCRCMISPASVQFGDTFWGGLFAFKTLFEHCHANFARVLPFCWCVGATGSVGSRQKHRFSLWARRSIFPAPYSGSATGQQNQSWWPSRSPSRLPIRQSCRGLLTRFLVCCGSEECWYSGRNV